MPHLYPVYSCTGGEMFFTRDKMSVTMRFGELNMNNEGNAFGNFSPSFPSRGNPYFAFKDIWSSRKVHSGVVCIWDNRTHLDFSILRVY